MSRNEERSLKNVMLVDLIQTLQLQSNGCLQETVEILSQQANFNIPQTLTFACLVSELSWASVARDLEDLDTGTPNRYSSRASYTHAHTHTHKYIH